MDPKIKEFFIYPKQNSETIRRPYKMSYTQWGEGDNLIICVHGLARNSRDFDHLAKNLAAKNYCVIAPDIIGRGKSDWLDDKSLYNYNTYHEHMQIFLEHFESEITWIGTSMGGIIGMMLLNSGNKYIKKLVLNDIGPYIPAAALKRIAKYIGLEPSFDNLEMAKEHYRRILAPFGIKREEDWDHITKYGTHLKNGKYYLAYDPAISKSSFAEKLEDIVNVDMWDIWNKIKIPTLILRGAKSDVLTHDTFVTLQNSENVEAYEFEGYGHTPSLFENDHIEKIVNFVNK